MPESSKAERIWLERELETLRAREAEYRERLEERTELSARLHAHSESLQRLFLRSPPAHAHLTHTLRDVARLSAQALEIRRSSVWLFDPDRAHLHCVVQLVDDAEAPAIDTVIDSEHCPRYVAALSIGNPLAVDDAPNDSRTRELGAYLEERGIGALLDVPIVIPGSLLGVVCHEHVGSNRKWHRDEVEFASHVGQLVAVALSTERRIAAEYAARGTEAKYRHLVEALPVVVYSFDARTRALDYVSPRVSDLGGWSAETILAGGADAWVGRIHPEDRASVLERFAIGAGQGFPEEVSYRIDCPDGRTRWVRDTCGVVRDGAGRPIAMQGVIADVTERTEADLARREIERRYHALLDNVDLVAVSLDTEGRATFVNEAFVRMSGYSREEVLGTDWFEKVLPPSERDAVRGRFLSDVRKGTVVPRFELTIVTRLGEQRLLLCANTILRRSDESVEGTSSLALDITNRRRMESELLQQTKLESLGRLAASVAHDFNNLLTVLISEVELLRHSPGSSTAERHAAIDHAFEQAKDLTRSLLTYGRRQPIRAETLVLDDLVREAVPLLQALVGRDLTVTTSLHAEGANVKVDRASARQVLFNLVGNASDATRDHGSGVRVGTAVERVDDVTARAKGARDGGEFVVLSISDDGRGMDPKTIARVFDPFFTTKANGRGTGLGLAISQTVASQAGGFITVESELGKGTTFRVHFPVARAAMQRPSPRTIAREAASAGRRHVLVVDDVETIAELVARTLRSEGYEVVLAHGVKGALDILTSEPIDLLLSDVKLADGSGLALGRSARAVRPGLRVVLMSGSGEIEESFDGMLQKPFDTKTLLAVVRAALAKT